MSDMFLTEDEVCELTAKRQHAAQIRVLRQMGIEHRERPDGSVAILRAHVEAILGVTPAKRTRKKTEPNFEALDAATA